MYHGGAGLARISSTDDGGQHLVIDFDQFSGVFGLKQGFSDDHCKLIADMAHLALRQWWMRRFFHRLAVDIGNQPAAGQAADFRCGKIITGVDRHYTGCGLRLADIDAANVCMRMRRAQKVGVGLTGDGHIVGVASATGEKALVFLAFDTLANIRSVHDVSLSWRLRRRPQP